MDKGRARRKNVGEPCLWAQLWREGGARSVFWRGSVWARGRIGRRMLGRLREGREPGAEVAQILPRALEDGLKRKCLGQRQHHATNAHANGGTDLQQLQANRVALRVGQLCVTQTKIAQRTHDEVRDRKSTR